MYKKANISPNTHTHTHIYIYIYIYIYYYNVTVQPVSHYAPWISFHACLIKKNRHGRIYHFFQKFFSHLRIKGREYGAND